MAEAVWDGGACTVRAASRVGCFVLLGGGGSFRILRGSWKLSKRAYADVLEFERLLKEISL